MISREIFKDGGFQENVFSEWYNVNLLLGSTHVGKTLNLFHLALYKSQYEKVVVVTTEFSENIAYEKLVFTKNEYEVGNLDNVILVEVSTGSTLEVLYEIVKHKLDELNVVDIPEMFIDCIDVIQHNAKKEENEPRNLWYEKLLKDIVMLSTTLQININCCGQLHKLKPNGGEFIIDTPINYEHINIYTKFK